MALYVSKLQNYILIWVTFSKGQWVNSLAPREFEWNFRYVIFKWILAIGGWGISCEIVLVWMSLDFIDGQSTLVQVMAWCHQAASHYLSQCWPRSLSPYGVTRPQWVNHELDSCDLFIVEARTKPPRNCDQSGRGKDCFTKNFSKNKKNILFVCYIIHLQFYTFLKRNGAVIQTKVLWWNDPLFSSGRKVNFYENYEEIWWTFVK